MLLSQDSGSRDRSSMGINDHKMQEESSDDDDEKVDVGSVADLRPNFCFSGEQEVPSNGLRSKENNNETTKRDSYSLSGSFDKNRTSPTAPSPVVSSEGGPSVSVSSSFPPSHMMPYLYTSGLYLPPPPGVFLPGGNPAPFPLAGPFGQSPPTSSFHPNLLYNAHLAMSQSLFNQSYSPTSDPMKYHHQRFWPYPVVTTPVSLSGSQPVLSELRSPMSTGSPYDSSHFKCSSSPGSDGGTSSVGSSSSDLKSMENMVNGLERQQGMPVTLSTLRDK
ncbi:hypothetical protein X975_19222, partial [Stegodyphus mimosarum]